MMNADKIEIDTTFQCGAWDEGISLLARDAVLKTLNSINFGEKSEISLVFADNDFVQVLNANYRGKDKPTNVLSFPQDEPELLGDVILAYETVKCEADEQNKTFEDHTRHLIVHGTLHLLGYDHIEDEEAEEMEALEIKILADMGIKNPYENAFSMA